MRAVSVVRLVKIDTKLVGGKKVDSFGLLGEGKSRMKSTLKHSRSLAVIQQIGFRTKHTGGPQYITENHKYSTMSARKDGM